MASTNLTKRIPYGLPNETKQISYLSVSNSSFIREAFLIEIYIIDYAKGPMFVWELFGVRGVRGRLEEVSRLRVRVLRIK